MRDVVAHEKAVSKPHRRSAGDAIEVQQRLLRVLTEIGVNYEIAAGYVEVTRQAVRMWAHGERRMPDDCFARLLALAPWCAVNAEMQAAGRMDAKAQAHVARCQGTIDALLNNALRDAGIGALVQEHWKGIAEGLNSDEGRKLLNSMMKRYATARPVKTRANWRWRRSALFGYQMPRTASG